MQDNKNYFDRAHVCYRRDHEVQKVFQVLDNRLVGSLQALVLQHLTQQLSAVGVERQAQVSEPLLYLNQPGRLLEELVSGHDVVKQGCHELLGVRAVNDEVRHLESVP